jgi:hypothetical protein
VLLNVRVPLVALLKVPSPLLLMRRIFLLPDKTLMTKYEDLLLLGI